MVVPPLPGSRQSHRGSEPKQPRLRRAGRAPGGRRANDQRSPGTDDPTGRAVRLLGASARTLCRRMAAPSPGAQAGAPYDRGPLQQFRNCQPHCGADRPFPSCNQPCPTKFIELRNWLLRTNWFIIFEARGSWWIDNEGTQFGPFTSKEAAGAEAVIITRKFGDKTRRSHIYWPDEKGRQQLIWEGV